LQTLTFVDIIEKGKVGIDLHNPIGLSEYDGANVEETCFPAQERLVLDPRNDIVQAP
jgi:hypothetical protein